MFKVRIIPCLDVKDGRVVKGVNFVDLRDAGDPVEAAIAYDAAGADELTFLDITASVENRGTLLDVVQRTAEACFMPVTVGGGVRTVEDIRVLLKSGDTERELFGGELGTTNNRMEMTAVIEALLALKRPCKVRLYLDSEYVRKGITEWIHGWKARGWKTAAKQPVKNVDLWQKLDAAVAFGGHEIQWHWVKGHAGDPGNERADALANRGVDKALSAR